MTVRVPDMNRRLANGVISHDLGTRRASQENPRMAPKPPGRVMTRKACPRGKGSRAVATTGERNDGAPGVVESALTGQNDCRQPDNSVVAIQQESDVRLYLDAATDLSARRRVARGMPSGVERDPNAARMHARKGRSAWSTARP